MFEYQGPNYVHQLDDKSYVSYNPAPCSDGIGVLFGWGNPNGSSETALRYNGKFFIVDGDFRSDYEKCTTGEEAFRKYKTLLAIYGKSAWGDDVE